MPRLFLVHQRPVIDLADARFRQFAPELDIARARPFDELRAAIFDQLLLYRRSAQGIILEHNESLHPLPLPLVGHADHAGLKHKRMLLQHRLDLRREDIEARGLDHSLEAVGEIEKSVRVHPAEVAGMQPNAAVAMHAQALAP